MKNKVSYIFSGTILKKGEKPESYNSPFEGEIIVPNFTSKNYTNMSDAHEKFFDEIIAYFKKNETFTPGFYKYDLTFAEKTTLDKNCSYGFRDRVFGEIKLSVDVSKNNKFVEFRSFQYSSL